MNPFAFVGLMLIFLASIAGFVVWFTSRFSKLIRDAKTAPPASADLLFSINLQLSVVVVLLAAILATLLAQHL